MQVASVSAGVSELRLRPPLLCLFPSRWRINLDSCKGENTFDLLLPTTYFSITMTYCNKEILRQEN